MTRERNYCGCCGRELLTYATEHAHEWCRDCLAHVGVGGMPWERTYLAMTGEDCPFQEIK